MTAVMRAVQAEGPRVLRIAVLQGGRVVDERLLRDRGPVTIGPDGASTFVAACPRELTLFERAGDGYVLCTAPGIRARVALEGGVRELDGAARVKLGEAARGKVVVGETTFLFQLVAPPPPQPRAQLPIAVKKGVTEIDWFTTIIASFSFLLHFFGVALVYSDWRDPVAPDEDAVVSALVESVKSLPPPPPAEKQKADATPEASAAAVADTKAPAANKDGGKGSTAGKGAGAKPGAAKADGNDADARAAELNASLDQLNVQMMGVFDGKGVATGEVFTDGNVPAAMMDEAARHGGVGNGEPFALKGTHDGKGGVGPIGGDGGEPGLDRKKTDDGGTTDPGKSKPQEGPKVGTTISFADPTGEVPGANAVVASMKGSFRACYMHGLDSHPEMQGSTVITATVGPNGDVIAAGGGGGPLAPIAGCLTGVVRSRSFSPPKSGGSVTLAIPVSFFLAH